MEDPKNDRQKKKISQVGNSSQRPNARICYGGCGPSVSLVGNHSLLCGNIWVTLFHIQSIQSGPWAFTSSRLRGAVVIPSPTSCHHFVGTQEQVQIKVNAPRVSHCNVLASDLFKFL